MVLQESDSGKQEAHRNTKRAREFVEDAKGRIHLALFDARQVCPVDMRPVGKRLLGNALRLADGNDPRSDPLIEEITAHTENVPDIYVFVQ